MNCKKYLSGGAALILLALICILLICSCDKNNENVLEKEGVRIMSYNIMHPDWSGLAESVPVRKRAGAAAALIREYMPDVIGLQEATEKWQKSLLQKLSGYEKVCCEKDGTVLLTCFLYNAEKLTVVESSITELIEDSDTRVFSYVVFERNEDKSRFVVANTHLPPLSHGPFFEQNCEDVIRLCGDIFEKYKGLPFIFLGDFNSGEDGGFYKRITDAYPFADAKYSAGETSGLYGTFLEGGYGGRINKKDSLCLDHIFVSSEAETERFFVVTGNKVKKISDHLPIVADISWE